MNSPSINYFPIHRHVRQLLRRVAWMQFLCKLKVSSLLCHSNFFFFSARYSLRKTKQKPLEKKKKKVEATCRFLQFRPELRIYIGRNEYQWRGVFFPHRLSWRFKPPLIYLYSFLNFCPGDQLRSKSIPPPGKSKIRAHLYSPEFSLDCCVYQRWPFCVKSLRSIYAATIVSRAIHVTCKRIETVPPS